MKTHVGVVPVMTALMTQFQYNKNVTFSMIDNDRGKGNAQPGSVLI